MRPGWAPLAGTARDAQPARPRPADHDHIAPTCRRRRDDRGPDVAEILKVAGSTTSSTFTGLPWDTIPSMVLSTADRFGDAEAVVDGDLRLSYVELCDRIRVAAGAFAEAGVGKGDRVAIWAPNSAEWIIAAFGVLAAGGVVVPVNTRFKAGEAADIILRSGSKLVLSQPGFLGADFAPPPGVRGIDLKSDFLASGKPFEAEVDGGDIADIIYTSGTTGRPKGVMMNHRQTLRLYAEWCDLADLRQGDRYLIVNPFFHTFGYKAGVIASLIRGATILPLAVFDVDRVCELVNREKITMLPGAPTVYHALLEVADKYELKSSTLRCAVTGAADIPVELIRRMKAELPFTSIMTGYGLTEAGTATASRPGDSFESIATTVGAPCDGVEVAIAADGEVLVRGYSVMQGYLDDPQATAEAVDADGWLHTGDLGSLDDRGYLKIIGRKKDMFIVGGFNAYPAEIEGFLMEHPAVAQAAVIGVPDERMGQVGKAFVVRRAGAEVTEEELIAWAKERMAGYKVPRSVEFRDSLPLNATGKVMKDQLR
ncbi:MAG: fatty acid--CoA ligase family protein [Frankia sp.]|nr:fatty acid--CoA ligase family protein [Frankia sp.]